MASVPLALPPGASAGLPVFAAARPLMEGPGADPPPPARNALHIQRFDQGQLGRDRLLRQTAHAIVRCGTDWPAALRCLDSLALAREPATGAGVAADVSVFNAAMGVCARTGRWPEAVQLFNRLLAGGLLPDSKTYTLAITACRRGGNPADGLGLFWHLSTFASRVGVRPNIHTLTTVISALGDAGHPDIAINLFRRLLAHDGPPGQRATLRTCNAVLEVCAAAGLQATALAVLRLMEAAPGDAGLAPNARSYMDAIGACDARTAQTLVDRGLDRGLLQASLGFDGQRNLLDLRQRAVLRRLPHPQDGCDVGTPMAAALVSRLAAQGAIDAETVFVSKETGSGRLPPSVQARLGTSPQGARCPAS